MLRVITWNTHKTDAGYEYHVYSLDYQQPNETLKRGVCKTRARAVGKARAWCRYFKQIQKAAA